MLRGRARTPTSEVEPQRELELPRRAEAHRAAPGAGPAADFEYGCPGCTLFASVSAAFGSALGSVPAGFAKFVKLNRLKISARSSTFGQLPSPRCLAIIRSACRIHGPCTSLRVRSPKV